MTMKQGNDYEEEQADLSSPDKPIKKKADTKTIMIIAIAASLVIIGIIIAIIVTGKDKTDETGTELETEYDPFASDEYDDWGSTPTMEYSSEELRLLTAYGITPDEIYEAQENYIPYYELEAEALARADEYLQSRYIELRAKTPEEIKRLYDYTWLGGEPVTLDVSEGDSGVYVRTENVDYEKIPLYGCQTFIKIYLKNGSVAFMQLDPLRYSQLADRDNIVVRIESSTYAGQEYIINLTEVAI